DLQSYLSDLSLFLALESKKFYILVDNQPWLSDLGCQLSCRREKKEGKEASSKSNAKGSNNFERWLPFLDAKTSSGKEVLPPINRLNTSLLLSSELNRTLYGFIVLKSHGPMFEVLTTTMSFSELYVFLVLRNILRAALFQRALEVNNWFITIDGGSNQSLEVYSNDPISELVEKTS
ncbi:hypothetical protein Goklo_020434, partial [Gossypium klotzschianum]|nr:hypothetical protein [Gossypium klotzschianum]